MANEAAILLLCLALYWIRKVTSTKERRGSPKGTDFKTATGRFAQQISAIATGRLLLRSVRQKRMMWARPRSRMFFCNVDSGREDA